MIVEGAFLVVSLLSPPVRRTCSQDFFQLVGGGESQSFTLSSGASVEEIISMQLNEISGVRCVRTHQSGQAILVEVELTKFDKATRWKVYEAEDDLHAEFPRHKLEFRVIDSSWVGNPENAPVS